ncbi:MAG: glutathione S-transferase C-terminal domain-containing protein [Proteobacteria bacterium]|nr:glutathione S-transferase C-terminal domain-containing protein [Pseudomonadota bacterium]
MFQIYGGPASPYSLKMRAVFRYRRIPHTWQVPQGGFSGTGSIGDQASDSPLKAAGKNVVPVIHYPDGSWKADSTPIMFELESLYPERSLVHPHPGIAFLAHLVEDMADEYLPFPMFYFRWTDDAAWCGRRQMVGWNGALDDSELEERAAAFSARQQAQLGAAASLPREQVLDNYERVLAALENQLKRSFFLFGSRPSFAEFGLFGQLSQYAVDPFVAGLMKQKAVRVYQWTHFLDDLSGIEGEWADAADCLTEELIGVLESMAPGYLMMMVMARQNADMSHYTEALNGPGYRVKCLLALKQELADLTAAERELIKPLLEAAGLWDALQFEAGEQGLVVDINPA